MNTPSSPLVDLSPIAWLLAVGVAVALVPLAWVAWRQRHAAPVARLHALTLVTLFLTFDLVLFGAFTRLTDSGLGCPDWPGCYGSASPIGALDEIRAEEALRPSGPVTHRKAWIEMVHRYLATGVGVLITVLAVASWRVSRRARAQGQPVPSPWWASVTLVWVCLQGAFGALTVTLKLYPAIVTAHLLGGLVLLALLAVQATAFGTPARAVLPSAVRRALAWAALAVGVQVALGGWVSTNYAVLACRDFPTCQGSWWPATDFGAAFELRRSLGHTGDGQLLPFEALTAIHLAHRLFALVVVLALGHAAWQLARHGERRWAGLFVGVLAWQLTSGLSNVVLGWPLLAAVAHTAGAAVLVVMLATLLSAPGRGLRAARPVHAAGASSTPHPPAQPIRT